MKPYGEHIRFYFRFDQAANILNKNFEDSEDQINVILSELRKSGLIKVDFDPTDARKRIYTLIDKQNELFKELKAKRQLTRADLETLLKGAADLIRTRVDYSFILLLFYKRISDKWEMEFEHAYKEALEDGLRKRKLQKKRKFNLSRS
jgi:type I restriction enzyme M protein